MYSRETLSFVSKPMNAAVSFEFILVRAAVELDSSSVKTSWTLKCGDASTEASRYIEPFEFIFIVTDNRDDGMLAAPGYFHFNLSNVNSFTQSDTLNSNLLKLAHANHKATCCRKTFFFLSKPRKH